MDTNKNTYTFIFAAVMVIIVAALLSVSYLLLDPSYKKNVRLEKKQNILKSVRIDVSRDNAVDAYSIYIKENLVLNYLGEVKQGMSAFDVKLEKEIKEDIENQNLPIYISEIEGVKKYIIPVRGKGLWGPIWGFISLNDDFNTIYGAVFDHEKETPGLGAEINQDFFQIQFRNKLIYEDSDVKFEVKKNSKGGEYEVNGVSGGTITSSGVTDMMQEILVKYLPYFKSISPEMKVDDIIKIIDYDEAGDSIFNVKKNRE